MIDIRKEADALASWPTHDRLRALKRILPRAHVEDILARAGQDRSPCPRLPGWFMVWFVVALGLVSRDCYRQVFRWLQPYRPGAIPPRSTFCEARHRLGLAPLRLLARDVVRLLGRPETPGAFYRGMRLMALDGFTVDLPDTPKNDHAFGRPGGHRAPGAFPQARVLALCETGSHVLWRWRIKPYHTGEVTMAHRLLRYLRRDMLLLWDRNFLSYRTLTEVRPTKAHLLARVKSNWIFEPIRTLPDGSYLAKFYASAKDRAADRDGIMVRIIEYTFDDPESPRLGRGPPAADDAPGPGARPGRDVDRPVPRTLGAGTVFPLAEMRAGARHFIAHNENGVTLQMYAALIVSLLIVLQTGRKPTKRTFEMIQFFCWAGSATRSSMPTSRS